MQDFSRYCQVIPAELPSLPLNQKHQLPDIPAVYFALGEGNEVLYIGRSGSLSARWLTHHRISELQSLGNVRLAWIELETKEFLGEVERVLIRHFSPKLNSVRGRTTPSTRTIEGVYIKLDAAEKEALQNAAERDDRTLADWVRRATRQKLRRLGFLPMAKGVPEKKLPKKTEQ